MSPALPAHAATRQATVALELVRLALGKNASGIPADAFLAQTFRQHREFGSRDRRLYGNLVFSFFRWKGWLDLFPDTPLERRAAIAYRLDYPDSHPAVDRLASLPAPDEPLDSLGAKARQAAIWMHLPDPPALEKLIPAGLLPHLAMPPSADGTPPCRPLLDSFQSRPPTWLRVRSDRRKQALEACQTFSLEPAPHPRLPLAWAIPDTARLADALAQCRGCAEIQDVASQAVGFVADPRPGEAWWDVCAGAAGKSLHLQDLANGRLAILATDARESILEQAASRARMAGRNSGFQFQRLDALVDPLPDRCFDGVLVDAPCSGSGTWARNPDARWRMSPESIDSFAARQAAILRRVADAVKPGGTLVYATCSLFLPENTGVIDAFLAGRPDFEPAPFIHPLTGESSPGHAFLWPWQGPGSGLFAARLTRRQASGQCDEKVRP